MSIVARNLSLRSQFGADRHPALSLATMYFALFNGDPTGAGVEPTSAGGYARVALANDAALWGVLSGSAVQASNAVAVTWPTATGLYSVAQVTHWGIMSLSTGGVLWHSGKLAAPKSVSGSGDVPRMPAGALQITQL